MNRYWLDYLIISVFAIFLMMVFAALYQTRIAAVQDGDGGLNFNFWEAELSREQIERKLQISKIEYAKALQFYLSETSKIGNLEISEEEKQVRKKLLREEYEEVILPKITVEMEKWSRELKLVSRQICLNAC